MEAVSELRQQDNRYKVTTTQPLTANRPAFYHLKDYNAAAAFIKGFKSVESNRQYQFLKVPAGQGQRCTQKLMRLADNPKDPEGLKALHDHAVSSYQLERVKFNPGELRLQELKEMGVVVTPKELEALKHGIPATELHDVRFKVGGIPVAGQVRAESLPGFERRGAGRIAEHAAVSGVRTRGVQDDVLHEREGAAARRQDARQAV